MFCPRCGQQQTTTETRFCSRCGFPMSGVTALVERGGVELTQAVPMKDSPRKRGLKQGLFLLLLTFLVVPLLAILTVWTDSEPWAIVIASIVLVVGGLLRMAYAGLFQSGNSSGDELATTSPGALHAATAESLPPASQRPASDFVAPVGSWRETNDLERVSVTDSTTKLLNKEQR